MIFLTNSDIEMRLDDENLSEIISNSCGTPNEELINQAELIALEDIKNAIRDRYDTDYELRAYSESGTNAYDRIYDPITDKITVNGTSGNILPDDRNVSVIQWVSDITVYNLYLRVAPRALNEIVADRFDTASDKLKMAQRGELSLDLRKRVDEDNEQVYKPMRFGLNLNAKRNDY